MAFRNEAFSFFSHALGALAAAVGLALLVARAETTLAVVSFAVYGVTMVVMFTTSSLHHVAHAEEGFFRKLDMSAIYLFIAGCYTPFCLLAFPQAWGVPILGFVWILALAGIVMRWTLPRTPRWLTATIYLALGWMSLAGVYPLYTAFGWGSLVLLGLGGVVYTVGAIVYARGRPDPWPEYIGYHGLWHIFVLAGAGFHFALVWTAL